MKSQTIYTIITFLEPIRELRIQSNQVNEIPMSNKPLQGQTEFTNCFPFGRAGKEETAAVKWVKKKKTAKILTNS